MLAFAVPASAHAASAGISVSADPTEEKPVTLTVSGVADTSTRLYVFEYAGTAACPATASGVSYFYELSGTDSYYSDGDAVAAGGYTRPYSFTPSAAGSYRVCAYLATSSSATPHVASSQTVTARMPAADVSFVVSGDPTEEEAVSITASGTTEVDRRLYVYALSGSAPCPSSASGISYYYELSGTDSYYADGDAVAAGSFSRTHTFIPAESGRYRLCAYVAETSGEGPNAQAAGQFTARTPTSQLRVSISPTEYQDGQAMSVGVTAASEVDRRLYVFLVPDAAACPTTASGNSYFEERTGTDSYYADGDPLDAGQPATRRYSFTATTEHENYRVCAYVGESSTDAEKVATAVAVRRRALAGVLVTSNEEEERDYLVLVWRRASEDERDRLYVYDRDPALGSSPVLSKRLDDRGLDVTFDGVNNRALVPRHLGYGRFWWRVARTDASGYRVLSEARTVRIVPRPLVASRAKAKTRIRLRKSSRRPGTASLLVKSSPMSKVRLVVRHAGRTVAHRTFTEDFGGARTITFKMSCGRTGRFKYSVDMTDPYGTNVTRTGSWVVSAARCARLKAAERERARRRAAPTPPDNGGGGGAGGGGCDGDPGATPYPQFPGQRDGDGDGCYGES